MLGRGDWRKLEDQINGVLEPMGERLKALEEAVEALTEPKADPKSTKSTKSTESA